MPVGPEPDIVGLTVVVDNEYGTMDLPRSEETFLGVGFKVRINNVEKQCCCEAREGST